MPNWCRNELTITGCKDCIDELVTVITNEDDTYSLTNTMPTPKEFDNMHSGSITIDDIRYSNWYEDENGTRTPVLDMTIDSLKEKYNCNNSIDWQYLNWGTKWGDLETTVTIDDDKTLSITFDSAWGEPFLLLQHIAEMYKVEIVNKYLDEFEYDLPEPHRSEYPMEDFNQVESYHIDSFVKLMKQFDR